MTEALVFVVGVEVFIEDPPFFVHLKCCFWLDPDLDFLDLFLLNNFNYIIYKILHLQGVRAVHDESNHCRLGTGLQFRLPDLSLRTVGLDALLEKFSKGDGLFSHAIDKEADIGVLQFICTSAIVIPLSETILV